MYRLSWHWKSDHDWLHKFIVYSDTSLADLETVDYNNNIRIDDLDIHLNINKIDLKKTSKNNRQLRELLKNTEFEKGKNRSKGLTKKLRMMFF